MNFSSKARAGLAGLIAVFAIGTTPAQIARGGFDNEDWYIGFSISRKFF